MRKKMSDDVVESVTILTEQSYSGKNIKDIVHDISLRFWNNTNSQGLKCY